MKQFLLACLIAQSAFAAEQADVVLTNATVYTVNDKQPTAEAVAVKGDRIVFVGSSVDAQRLVRPETRVIDLHGRAVYPGFTDAHCHIFGVGEREMTLNLEGTRTREAFLEKVRERAAQTPPNEWITGRGWIETFWTPPQFPTAADLDSVAPNHPVFLERADGHAAVANTAAMKIAGITADTKSPFGGNIVKAESGAPTGMFVDHAMQLVASHIPPPSHEQKAKAFSLGAKREISLGWCEIQNPGSDYDDVGIMRRAIDAGEVKLRIYNAASGPGQPADRLLREGPIADDHRFTMRTIKCYADGALGSRGADLLEPYSDAETSGYLVNKPEDLSRVFEEALRRGIQIQTHAIGDRANRLVLDLYEAAFAKVPPDKRKVREPRWRIEHAQILSPQDIPRFAKLGIIPSMQPSHAISDFFFAPARLGKERLAGAYAWETLIKSGAIIPGGSDAPVERGEPLIEFYAAVARKSIDGFSNADWHPEEAVTREQALKMFTAWPAFAAFEEKDKGSIEVGKLADLTVFSADIMKIAEPEILKTHCIMTVVGGEVVYHAPND